MKVLLTTPTYPPFNSGLGNVVNRQAKALVAKGYEVVIATSGRTRSTSIEADGARIERFDVSGAGYLRNPIRGDIESYLNFLLAEPRDVLIMHAWQTWSTDIALARLSQITGRKYVHSHCVSTNMWLPYDRLRSLASWLLWRPYWWKLSKRMRQLDGVIFLAEGGSDSRFDDLRMARRLGVRVDVVPNAIEADTHSAGDPERNQIISVGSFTRAKGFDFVIEAYAKSAAANRMPLALFGQEVTPFAAELEAMAKSLGIRPSMISMHAGVTGTDLIEQYRRAKVFLFGSYTECQPLVLLDAMATGTPFVARNTGCIADMAGGRSVRTATEAAVELDQLLIHDSNWSMLSQAGRQAAQTTYSPEQNIEALISIIEGGRRGH